MASAFYIFLYYVKRLAGQSAFYVCLYVCVVHKNGNVWKKWQSGSQWNIECKEDQFAAIMHEGSNCDRNRALGWSHVSHY